MRIGILAAALAAAAAAAPAPAGAWTLSEYQLPSGVTPQALTSGNDGTLWFADFTNRLGRFGLDGSLNLFATPGQPSDLAAGLDGRIWFTEPNAHKVGRLAPGVAAVDYSAGASAAPGYIASGPDTALWFTDRGTNAVGRVDGAGTVTEYALPAASATPDIYEIAAGHDNGLWFTDCANHRINRIDATTHAYTPADVGGCPVRIAWGPDNALWFTRPLEAENSIGRLSSDGLSKTNYPIPTAGADAQSIVTGTDGALWFTESDVGKIGRLTTGGTFTEIAVPGATYISAMTVGPDGALWFVGTGSPYRLGRLTTETPVQGPAGPGGGQGPVGPQGPTGGPGPAGPAGKDRALLVAVLGLERYRVRRRHALRVLFGSTLAGTATLEVRRGTRRVARVSGRVRRGRNSLTVPRLSTAGRYTLRLTATAATQTSTDTSPLVVTR
ncbi:MAG: virginiamycin lyase [Solirubrobacteraceae bacterium]|jgi:virginiamycin B lyase|nr:virginiamycin lyase [Solirubrobacteraceae bacterium]